MADLNRADELNQHLSYSKTLSIMLHDLLCAEDNIPDDRDVNDPSSRTQRMFVVLETLQNKLDAISEIVEAPK